MKDIMDTLVENKNLFFDKEGLCISQENDQIKYVEANETIMNDLIKASKNSGWKKAVKDILEGYERLPANYILNSSRSNFLSVLPTLNEAEYAIDIGSGMGCILYRLSGLYETVIANESTYQRLLFSKIRMEQENINNIKYLNQNFIDANFKENIFDLVILNGVLEWVPLSFSLEIKPKEAQIEFLRRIYRNLKKGGVLYIGIENRFSKNAFLGAGDPHTGVRYNSVVPRFLADYLIQRKFKATNDNRYFRSDMQKNKYRTYTYSYMGYKKILSEIGFSKILISIPVPTYNVPKIIISASSDKVLRDNIHLFTNNQLQTLLYLLFPKLIKYLAFSYSIYAIK